MKAGTPEDQARWRKFRSEIPEVPLHTIEGRLAIAPAEKWEKKRNAENGELYPVFPFRCFGLGLGSGELVEWTMQHRTCPDAYGDACWTQDQIHWAYAGHAAEAARRIGAPLPHRLGDVPFPAVRARGARFLPRLRSLRLGLDGACSGCWCRRPATKYCCCRPGRPTGMPISSST